MGFIGRRLCFSTSSRRPPGLVTLVCLALWLGGAQGAPPSIDPDDLTLEEVVVSARKFEENLLGVPASVQVVPGALIEVLNVSSLYGLQFHVPGLVATSAGMFGAGIALRGVTDQGISGSRSVAPHLDGVYLGQSNLALARLFDVERVEVLKGPQGTLYGRNSTGGSINIISRPPGDALGAGVEIARGSFETVRAEGHVNLPADRFAVRLAAVASDGNGYIHNSVDDRKFAEQDYYGLRGSVRATPTDRTLIDLTAQHVVDDGATGELWLPSKNFLPDPDDIHRTTVTLDDPYLRTTNDNVSLNVAWDLDRAVLRSVTGRARNETRDADDCAGNPFLAGCVRGVHPLTYDQWSQELRLESLTGGPTRWLAALYWLDADTSTHYDLTVPLISPDPLNDVSDTEDDRSYALFGEATRRLDDRWSVTGGLRLSYERIHARSVGTGRDDSPTPVTDRKSWRNTSWRAGVEYAAGPGQLLWANVATGFKSGGFNTFAWLPTGGFSHFDPETLTAWEAGINLRLPAPRATFRAAAFRYDIRDMQVQTVTIVGDRAPSVIDNANSATIYGLDVSGEVGIGDGLTLAGGLVWLPTREFDDFTIPDTNQDLSGNTLIRAPRWSASASADYRLPVARAGHLTMRVDYNLRSRFYFTKENLSAESQQGFGLLDLLLRFDSAGDRWFAFAIARNVTDADYFNQAFIQASPGYGANQEVGFGVRF